MVRENNISIPNTREELLRQISRIQQKMDSVKNPQELESYYPEMERLHKELKALEK